VNVNLNVRVNVIVLVSVMLLAGCETTPPGPELPPLICKTPGALPSPWFTDVTSEMGLDAVLATTVQAADLDGDGWTDLVAWAGTPARENATRRRFVLLNRPRDGGGRRFVDFTAESGILATRDGAGGRAIGIAALGDLDNDGDVDAIVCAGVPDLNTVDPCSAYLNDGAAHFTLAPPSGLEVEIWLIASGALLDFDRDGFLDFWPAGYEIQPVLFRGRGDGTFDDVGGAVGLPTMSGPPAQHLSYRRTFGVTACDYDGDGDEDVFLADYGREANQLWKNDGGRLVEVAQSLGVAFDDRMDYSDDHSYQCYCKANPGACPPTVTLPADCSFTRGWVPGQSDQPWRLGGNNFSITCGDLDDDGDLDLMTATIRHGDVGSASDPSEILVSDGTRFTRPGNLATGIDRPHTGINWNEGDMSPVFADVDLDGRKDIYLASSDYPGNHGWLWRNKGDGTFEDVTTASGAGATQIHGVAFVDLDGDGDLDLVAGTSTARGGAPRQALRVYRNVAGQERNFIRLRLTGSGTGGANRSAIGARVRITAGGRTQTHLVQGGYGHTNVEGDFFVTAGLGSACMVDEVEVRWPDASGTVTTYRDLRANYTVELRMNEPDPVYLISAAAP
jgi:hypothetical protein